MDFASISLKTNVGAYLVFSFFIFLIFRLLQLLLVKYYRTKSKPVFKKALYLIEYIFWFVVIYQGIALFKSRNMVFSAFCFIILLVAVVWSTWFILIDYLAGLYLKIEGAYTLGETIEFDGYTGRIVKIGSRFLELELSASKIIKIPFHLFFVKRTIHTGTSDNCAKEIFTFKLNPKYDAIESLENIKMYIHQLPWTSDKYEQEVLLEKSGDEGTFIQINASLFDKKYLGKFKQMISNRFES